MSFSDTVKGSQGAGGAGEGLGGKRRHGNLYRISGRLLSVIFLFVVLIAIGCATWNVSDKLKTTQKGLESLIKSQAIEISELRDEVKAEREARNVEFNSAANARAANKKFQEETLNEIKGLAKEIQDSAIAQNEETQDVTKKILAAVAATRKSAITSKNEAIETQQRIKKQNKILQKQSRPLIKLF